MRINGFDKDPLAPTKRQILASEDGVHFTVVGTTTEELPLLSLHIDTQHAVKAKESTMMIVNQKTREVEAKFDPYIAPIRDLDEPPDDHFLEVRDRWLDKVMKFLLPPRLYAQKDMEHKQRAIRRWFAHNDIEIMVHPVNGAVRVIRKGALLTEFGV